MPAIKKKLYYKIGEVCEITGIQTHVLRYWESEFPLLRPKKNRAGQRLYQYKDIEIVSTIKRLLYKEGFTIAGARRRLKESLKDGGKGENQPSGKKVELSDQSEAEILKSIRNDLIDIKKALKRLKI